jgi:CopG family nickel-responsive transcriptional regulator
MDKERFSRFSISLPESLLNEFDSIIEEMKMNRSDAVRKAMRNFIMEYNWTKHKGETTLKAGTISIIFDHTEKVGMMDELNELQHEYFDIIDAALHIHLDKENCMLIMAVKGDSEKINDFLKNLNSRPEYRQVKQTLLESERENKGLHVHGHGHSHIH